jgi:hypothetical protein
MKKKKGFKKDVYVSLYNERHFKVKNSIWKILLVFISIISLLMVVRLLNIVLLWNMTKLEIINNKMTRKADYRFFGLSNYDETKQKLANSPEVKFKDVMVYSYFDIFHPVVFLVHTKGDKTFVNLGQMAIYPEPGITGVKLYLQEIIEVEDEKFGDRAIYYGQSLIPQIYEMLANTVYSKEVGEKQADQKISYVLKSVRDSKYLRIPYYIYFYAPLIFILFLGSYYGLVGYVSFFYYLEMFLLFNYKRVLFLIPFSWLINLFGLKISDGTAVFLSALITVIFVIIAFIGIFHKRQKGPNKPVLTIWCKAYCLFFLLLPLFLRF